ncbi:MAG TPA: hypothetical protein VMM93_12310 [Vicinamibacterales bacterium]|nr:hypothetical protein [Vicinamibacterales bacterium]
MKIVDLNLLLYASNEDAPREALETVDAWLSQPLTTVLHPGDEHWTILRRLIGETEAAGNLTSDAHFVGWGEFRTPHVRVRCADDGRGADAVAGG